jgi:Zn-dependent M28 family amino/carboxypeptidase
LYAKKVGVVHPEDIILFLSHKDSQSWVDSPGAYDNCAGTVSTMEVARILKDYPSRCSIWFLFCNEEHTPWTSVTAAQNAKLRNDNLIAIFNLDSMGGKSQADINANRKTNVTLFTEPEGERFADLMDEVNEIYQIGLTQRKHQRQSPGDDDGSFIKAGFPMAIMNVGSFPYADPNYHLETDIPELVDIQNLCMSTQASLAAGLSVDLEKA